MDGLTTIRCPGTTTCTFEAEQHANILVPRQGVGWALCTQVDGNFMAEPPCEAQSLDSTTGRVNGSWAQTRSGLAPGSHTVQTFVYTDDVDGVAVDFYEFTYRVYVP